jgi:hypothetical protein
MESLADWAVATAPAQQMPKQLTVAMQEGWLEAADGREVQRYHRNPASSWR